MQPPAKDVCAHTLPERPEDPQRCLFRFLEQTYGPHVAAAARRVYNDQKAAMQRYHEAQRRSATIAARAATPRRRRSPR